MADTSREPRSGEERIDRLVQWVKGHRRTATIAGAVVLVVAIGIWFTVTARQRREAFAARELIQARNAADQGNLPLAANDLSRLMSGYGGTAAADEAAILLAQIRLQQGQPELAVAALRELLASGPQQRFRAPAMSLLGAALEQSGNLTEAAQAYQEGAQAAQYELLKLQLLMEAGRAYTMADDTAQAAAIYESIIREHPEAPGLGEVRLRLSEIRRSDIAS